MTKFKTDRNLILGIFFMLISSIIYHIEDNFFQDTSDLLSVSFLIHYGLALTFGTFSFLKFRRKFWHLFGPETLSSHTILLVLFNISAYSLNKTIPVFNDSVDWLSIFIISENVLLVWLVMLKKPSKNLTIIFVFFFAMALLFNVYQAFMVLPAFVLGILGSFLLGISLLLFVPLFYMHCIISLLRHLKWCPPFTYSFIAGISIGLMITTIYVVQWKKTEKALISGSLQLDSPFSNKELPDWISIAQNIDQNALTERYLKSGLVYQEFNNYDDGFSSIWRSALTQKYKHDPLVSISSLFSEHGAIDDNSKIKVLNYLFNARHQSAERFWSGENLKTNRIVTNVELFPNERLSFTELIITIKNSRSTDKRWGSQQEALYTFQLPEGGVVTSLSLWIEGVEEKAILTSKKKAEKAYSTIVGKEMRDPSVVYWMEGNQVRVRVFPCTPNENRKFKIGVTAPLFAQMEELLYQPISFIGPDYSTCTSSINLVLNGSQLIDASLKFEKGELFDSWEGDYATDWNIKIKSEPLTNSVFSYNDESYQLLESVYTQRPMDTEIVYLDISKTWTSDELDDLNDILSGIKVKVFSRNSRKMDIEKWQQLNDEKLPTFTLFPFHKIPNTAKTIVITKGGALTPNLSDMENTPFRKQLFTYFKSQKTPPLVLDFGEFPTNYMRSLKEFSVIDLQPVSLTALRNCFKTNVFPSRINNPNTIQVANSGLSIQRMEQQPETATKAPDHLMRLFYYQQIMNEIGNKYFGDSTNDYLLDKLVNKASIANIVTPLSSLIVLETQRDYERFGIEENKDSLGNAAINNSGAVPEPHEWAIIIIGALFCLSIILKSKYRFKNI